LRELGCGGGGQGRQLFGEQLFKEEKGLQKYSPRASGRKEHFRSIE
jgi:hypothetical protein